MTPTEAALALLYEKGCERRSEAAFKRVVRACKVLNADLVAVLKALEYVTGRGEAYDEYCAEAVGLPVFTFGKPSASSATTPSNSSAQTPKHPR